MPEYFAFRVQLLDVKPPIWRAFFLQQSATFGDLHVAIQDACGWTNAHLFAFQETQQGPVIAGVPDDSALVPSEPDARQVKVSSTFKRPKDSCFYLYDFGDDWWHTVTLVEMVDQKHQFARRLVGGERAFPPEDCGGIHGYKECIATLKLKPIQISGAALKQRKEWLGDWRPERFDLDRTKQRFDR